MSKILETYKKIAENAVNGYRKVENGVVSGYHKFENSAVNGFLRVSDFCIFRLFSRKGETLEETKKRLSK